MKPKNCKYLPLFFLFLLNLSGPAFNLAAQTPALSLGARIYHVEGDEFTITSRSERRVYRSLNLGPEGFVVPPGAVLQTGNGSLEIQLIPSGTVIKAGKNTSFVYTGTDERGRFNDLNLQYGNLRVVTGNGQGIRDVVVRMGNIVARLPNGDTGLQFDLVPPSESRVGGAIRPLLKIYEFAGSMEIFAFPTGQSPGASFYDGPSIKINELEMLTLELTAPLIFTERKALEQRDLAFWEANKFAGTSLVAMPDTALPVPKGSQAASGGLTRVPSSQSSGGQSSGESSGEHPSLGGAQIRSISTRVDYAPIKRGLLIKNIILGAGLGVTAVSAAVQGFAAMNFDGPSGDSMRTAHNIGYIPLGIGIAAILVGIIYNPPIPSTP
jgi:hypothetical protein